jgi:putative methionine-R-sulfoxide reductase with GAF domain
MKKLKSMYSSLSKNQAQAFWICLIMTALTLVAIVTSTIPSFGNEPTFGNVVGKIIPVANFLVTLSAGLLILNRRFTWAGWVVILGVGLSLLLVPLTVNGLGFIVAALVFVSCSYFASLILEKRAASAAQYGSAAIAIAILLLEMYWPGSRPEIGARDFSITLYCSLAAFAMYITFLVRMFPNFQLRTKLTIFALVLGIVPMFIIGWMSSQVARNALTDDADESLTTSAIQLASSLDSFISFNLDSVRTEAKLKQVVEFLEMDSAERKGSPQEKQLVSMLTALQQKSSLMIHSYILMDRFGIVVTDTSSEILYHDQSNQVYFRETVKTGLPYVTPVIYPEMGSRAVIYFSAPVRSAAGEIIGVLSLEYNADVFQQQLLSQTNTTGHMGTFYILAGENNTLLAHTGNTDLMYRSTVLLTPEKYREMQSAGYMPADQPQEKMVFDFPDIQSGISLMSQGISTMNGEFHNFEQDQSGNLERGAVAALKTVPWHVFSVQETDMLYAPINNMIRGIVMMGIVAGLVSVVFGVIVSQYLTSPLLRLVTAAQKIAEGDFSARATAVHNDEVGTLSRTFNTMASQLSSLIGSLEQRVADRTKALVTSTEVSRRLSTILDPQELVKAVVEQLQQSFNYYHVHIYLLDERGENMRLAGGTGDAARMMMERGHQITKGKGLVGQAAETGLPVLVSDVSLASGWLPNPLLPATQAELAVPIAVGDEVIGVLDVQQNSVGGLQQSDADLLQSIANQVAVALQNARSYEETKRLAAREALTAAISQRIQRTNTAEEALQVAVRELGRALDVPHATVRLGVKSGNGNGNGNGNGSGHQHS